jgi:hypothetical protein
MTERPSIPYWHLWTDENGISRQRLCQIANFELKPIQPGAAPQWQGQKNSDDMSTMITVLPAGWAADWHENPKPQWIIPLSGSWFVEAMDGSRVEFGVGGLSFGGDQNCRETDGKKGHKSGTVGNSPAVLMIVQFNTMAAPPAPCAFR